MVVNPGLHYLLVVKSDENIECKKGAAIIASSSGKIRNRNNATKTSTMDG
jgi:hypothetical protein